MLESFWEPSSLRYSSLVSPELKICRHDNQSVFSVSEGQPQFLVGGMGEGGEERKLTFGTPVEEEEEEEGDISHA